MDHLIGTKLGNYELEKQLGRGGMARVYKALDITLKRSVAIKVIDPGFVNDEKYRERFTREAQSIAALEHPNIVSVYYFGEQGGLYFLAMKFIEGEDLANLMERYHRFGEYLPYQDMLNIMEGIATALDYAHTKGVVHRDIKPSNIMIDVEGRPYLTDFGLALNLSQGTFGDVLGTPHYVSPEQAQSSSLAVPQSDLYSLGVVLFELLTGVLPFDDPNPTAVALQHVMKEPPPPRALNPQLTEQTEAVLLKALSKDPAQRYPTAKELVQALRSALQNAGTPRDNMEIPSLPPLPSGMTPPPPRRESPHSVISQVQLSIAQRNQTPPPSELTKSATQPQASVPLIPTVQPATLGRQPTQPAPQEPTVPKVTQSNRPPTSARPATIQSRPKKPTPAKPKRPVWLIPALVFVGVALVVALLVLVVVSTGNPTATAVAIIPTEAQIKTDEPTEQPPTTAGPIVETTAEATVEPSHTPEPPTATSIPPTATDTIIPPTDTDTAEPPTAAPTTPAPSDTPAPTVELATAFPQDWLKVRFEYNQNTFFWVNESVQRLSVSRIAFARADGTNRFEGARWAPFYSWLERDKCNRLVAFRLDPTLGRPDDCSGANAQINGNSTETFWTGETGQFLVFWNNEQIAVCETNSAASPKLCQAAVPPN